MGNNEKYKVYILHGFKIEPKFKNRGNGIQMDQYWKICNDNIYF